MYSPQFRRLKAAQGSALQCLRFLVICIVFRSLDESGSSEENGQTGATSGTAALGNRDWLYDNFVLDFADVYVRERLPQELHVQSLRGTQFVLGA